MDEATGKLSLDLLPEETLLGGTVSRRIFSTENMEIVFYSYREGAVFPLHSHPEEQTTYVLGGEITFFVQGREIELLSGDLCHIPPGVPHSAVAGTAEPVDTINIFYPRRKKRP